MPRESGQHGVRLEQQVPGLGRVLLAALCSRYSGKLLEAAEKLNRLDGCIASIVSSDFIAKTGVTLYDVLLALILSCRLRTVGLGVARRPYLDPLILLARNRNIASVAELNRLETGRTVLLAVCCAANNRDKLQAVDRLLGEVEGVQCDALSQLEPRLAEEILVFSIDSKMFRLQKR